MTSKLLGSLHRGFILNFCVVSGLYFSTLKKTQLSILKCSEKHNYLTTKGKGGPAHIQVDLEQHLTAAVNSFV